MNNTLESVNFSTSPNDFDKGFIFRVGSTIDAAFIAKTLGLDAHSEETISNYATLTGHAKAVVWFD